MKVFLSSYDVQNGGQGVGVLVNKKAAINAVIGWCKNLRNGGKCGVTAP